MVEHYDFFHGKKTLSLDVETSKNRASIRIGTDDHFWKFHRKGETTKIFKKADGTIARIAREKNIEIELIFDTANINMRAWLLARHKELGITLEDSDPNQYRITAHKIYLPDTISP